MYTQKRNSADNHSSSVAGKAVNTSRIDKPAPPEVSMDEKLKQGSTDRILRGQFSPPADSRDNNKNTSGPGTKINIQAKLAVGRPDDKYEREADKMADEVISNKDPKPGSRITGSILQTHVISRHVSSTVSRLEEEENRKKPFLPEDTSFNKKGSEDAQASFQDKPDIRRKTNGFSSKNTSSSVENIINASKGLGSPLPGSTREFMEKGFGTDFGKVRIHTDSNSEHLNKHLNSLAFTHGNDIYFRHGQFNSATTSGKKLLAHELTHTIQQGNGIHPLIQRKAANEGDPIDIIHIFLNEDGKTGQMNARSESRKLLYTYTVSYNELLPQDNPYQVERDPVMDKVIFGNESKSLILRYQYPKGTPDLQSLERKEKYLIYVHAAKSGKSGEKEKPGGETGSGEFGTKKSPDVEDKEQKGVTITPLATPEDIEFVRRIFRELFGEEIYQKKIGKQALDIYLSMAEIKALKDLDKDPEKQQIIQMIQASTKKQSDINPDAIEFDTFIETVKEQYEIIKTSEQLGLDLSVSGGENRHALVNRPVRGDIIDKNGGIHVPGKEAIFEFAVKDMVDLFAVPHVYIKWFAYKKEGEKLVETASDDNNYIGLDDKGFLLDYQFDFTFKQTGSYEIHAFVYHNFYHPAHFSHNVEVITEQEALKKLESTAEKSFGTVDPESKKQIHFTDVWKENVTVDVLLGLFSPAVAFTLFFNPSAEEYGERYTGELSEELFKEGGEGNFIRSTAYLETQIKHLDMLIKKYDLEATKGNTSNADLKTWAESRKKKLQDTIAKLTELKGKDTTFPVATQAFYVSRESGGAYSPLRLVCWFDYDTTEKKYNGHIYDHSEIISSEHFHLRDSADNYEDMMQKLFFQLTKTYPQGRMSFMFQNYKKLKPQKSFIKYERDTDTELKKLKRVLFSQPVSIIVNTAAAILTVFPPTTLIGIGISLAYNSTDSILNFMEAQRTDTVKASDYVDLAMISLDIIPLIGQAKPIAKVGSVTYKMLKVGENIAEYGGMVYIFNAQVQQQIEQLRDTKISKLAELETEINILRENRASATEIERKVRQRDSMIEDIRNDALEIYVKAGSQMGLSMATPMAAGKLAQKYPLSKGRPGSAEAAEPDVSRPEGEQSTLPHAGKKPVPEEPSVRLIEREAGMVSKVLSKLPAKSDPVLALGLPAGMREEVPVIRTDEAGSEVRVHFTTGMFGLIEKIRVEAGKNATRKDIELHLGTIQTMQKYQGISGAFYILLRQIKGIILDRKLPPSTRHRAFEAELEVAKLSEMIKEKAKMLEDKKTALTDKEIAEFNEHLNDLQNQLAEHRKILEENKREKGVGHVAAKDTVKTGDYTLTLAEFKQQRDKYVEYLKSQYGDTDQVQFVISMLDKIETKQKSSLAPEKTYSASDFTQVKDALETFLLVNNPDQFERFKHLDKAYDSYELAYVYQMTFFILSNKEIKGRVLTDLQAEIAEFRKRNVPNKKEGGITTGGTVAAGKLLIEGIPSKTFSAGSKKAYKEGDQTVNTRYQSPSENPQFRDHAEQTVLGDIADHLDQQIKDKKVSGRDVTGEIVIHVDQPVCNICRQGLNTTADPGIIKQFSEQFPNLTIIFTGEGMTSPLIVRGGKQI